MIKYVLDTNVYIEAHTSYYNPDFAESYWDVLSELGKKGIILSPRQVFDEISDANSWLSNWKKKSSDIFLSRDVDDVLDSYKEAIVAYKEVKKVNVASLVAKNPKFNHTGPEPLSDDDFYVIATAMRLKEQNPDDEFVVVTKENRAINFNKCVRIPHVCDKLGVRCIDDFKFINEVGIKFDAKLS